jgi:hypothetical protein
LVLVAAVREYHLAALVVAVVAVSLGLRLH